MLYLGIQSMAKALVLTYFTNKHNIMKLPNFGACEEDSSVT